MEFTSAIPLANFYLLLPLNPGKGGNIGDINHLTYF